MIDRGAHPQAVLGKSEDRSEGVLLWHLQYRDMLKTPLATLDTRAGPRHKKARREKPRRARMQRLASKGYTALSARGGEAA
jgi:hypothetical protein